MTTASTPARRRQLVPLLSWLPRYQPTWLGADAIAGLITAAVVIPKAMAYATIAGLPPQVGLYTVLVPMVLYAVLGGSRPLSVSTTTTLAILTGAELAKVAPGGDPAALIAACATLTALVGAALVVASLLRFGFLASFISEPVLQGFKAGIGLVIVLDQVPKLLGIHFAKGSFLHNALAIAQHLPETALVTLAVGLATILLLVGSEHLVPRAPAPLLALGAAIAATAWLGLPALGVHTVGAIPSGLPSLTLPILSLVQELWPAALGIALMSFTETIACGRAFAGHGEPQPDPNQELLATGTANFAGAIFGSMPAGGGTSQTAVNNVAGARTQLAALFTAATAAACLLFLAPLLAWMPEASLAAIVIVYSVGLIDPREFRAIRGVRRMEFRWALIACLGVVLLGTLQGILVAVVVSLFGLAYQVMDPQVYVLGRKPGTNVFRPLSDENPNDEVLPGLLMLRTEGRLFFANARLLGDRLKAVIDDARPKVVAWDMSGVPDLEYTALKMLSEGEQRMRELGIELWLVSLGQEVLRVVQLSPLGATLGRERMLFDLETAVTRYRARSGATLTSGASLA
jgi:high affinity sulfate transporter 1